MDIQYESYLYHFVLAIVIICVGQLFDSARYKKMREKLVQADTEAYYKRLANEASKMEQQRAQKRQVVVEQLDNIRKDNRILQDKLNAIISSNNLDLSDISYPSKSKLHNEEQNLKKLLTDLEAKKSQLQSIEHEMQSMTSDCELANDVYAEASFDQQKLINRLASSLRRIKEDNEQLENVLKSHNCPTSSEPQTKLDPDLLKYLKEHNDSLSLDFLEEAQETVLVLRATSVHENFQDYVNQLRKNQTNHDLELTRLQVEKKKVELRLREKRDSFGEAKGRLNETRIEYLLKNTGSANYLDTIREKNKVQQNVINFLKGSMELKLKYHSGFHRDRCWST